MNWIKKAIDNLKKINLRNPTNTDVKSLDKVWRAAYYQRINWAKQQKDQIHRIMVFKKRMADTAEYDVICKELKISKAEIGRSLGYHPVSIRNIFYRGFCSERVELAISQCIQKKLKNTTVLPALLNKRLQSLPHQ